MKEKLQEAIGDIYSVVYETILDYREDGEDEDADHLLAQLEMVRECVEKAVKELWYNIREGVEKSTPSLYFNINK